MRAQAVPIVQYDRLLNGEMTMCLHGAYEIRDPGIVGCSSGSNGDSVLGAAFLLSPPRQRVLLGPVSSIGRSRAPKNEGRPHDTRFVYLASTGGELET
jgi:hypothetical protein